MRKTNNINSIDIDDESSTGNIFWVVYDLDTAETLVSAPHYDELKWKQINLSAVDALQDALSELDESARYGSLEEAKQAAQDAADALATEHPEDDINLEIHRIRLEMVEMVNDIDCEAGSVKRRGSPVEEDADGEELPEQLDREGWLVRDAEEDEVGLGEAEDDEEAYDFDWRRQEAEVRPAADRLLGAPRDKKDKKGKKDKKDKKAARSRR